LSEQNIIKKIYNFYSKDLTAVEFEKLILKDTPEKYRYYIRSMDKSENSKSKPVEFFRFIKNFALAFLRKLSPVIRVIYTAVIIIFILAWMNDKWDWAMLSFIVLNILIMFEIADKLTARDELEVASDVQKNLIPDSAPYDKNFQTSFYYESAKEVGGDFLDFIKRNDGSYLISIGDISGKGMSAALYMLQVRLLLRYIAGQSQNPRCILSILNKNIFEHVKKNLYFSISLMEVSEKKLKLCRAGHTPLLYFNSKEGICRAVKQNGMAIGLNNSGLFEKSIEETEIETNSNDILALYSDGLTETMNYCKEEFGTERLKAIITEHSGKSAEEIKKCIITAIEKFRGYAEVHDDITLIIMKSL